MKRLFWSLLLAIGTAIGVWFFARRRMDALYGEVSHLREIERKYDAMLKNEAQRNTVFRDAVEEMQENAPLPPTENENGDERCHLYHTCPRIARRTFYRRG